jgi:DNA-binding transcriptional LysR family regulator
MFDFRLQVFHTVAKRLNFTKAAAELFISQPAVTKHIQETELHFKVKLFERNGTKIKLTPAGETLLQYTDELFAVYRKLEFEMNHFTQQKFGLLRIGASTTIAQYVLPPVLAAFHKKFRDINITLSIKNTEQIEHALLLKEIDLGLIEGQSKKTDIRYTEFIKDEIVLVADRTNPLAKKHFILPEDLKNFPLLLREPGSGTLEVITHALKTIDIKIAHLELEMQLGSSESIKSYLQHSNCLAFLSVHAILPELQKREFAIIDVKGLQIERYFYFIQQQGLPETLSDLFMKFAVHYGKINYLSALKTKSA